MNVRLADKAVLYFDRSILNPNRSLAPFGPSKSKLERGVESVRLVGLEDVGHEVQQPANRARSQTVTNRLHRLVLKFSSCHRFCVRACHHINRLGALLERPHYLPEVA